MTRPDLDAIEARALAATPEPWRPHHDAAGNDAIEGPDGTPLCEAVQRPEAIDSRGNTIYGATVQWKRDADWLFAAAARSDIPALVARARELEAALRAAIDVMEEAPGHSFDEGDGYMCTEADDDVLAGIAAARAVLADCHCGGRGWTPEVDADGYSTGRERYCDCPAGQRAKTGDA